MNTATATTTVAALHRPRLSSENHEKPQPKQQPQTAKEIIAASVKCLIEQLEAGHSHALTDYIDAMSRFHNYSFGNILEIARQKPDATWVAGFWKWKEFGRSVKKGEKGKKGIRIIASIVGVERKSDAEAEKNLTKQNTRKLVGFRHIYTFDAWQTEGAELAGLWRGVPEPRLKAFLLDLSGRVQAVRHPMPPSDMSDFASPASECAYH